MRTLWTILSVLAVANVLALAGFVGWLRATDRLDSARFTQVRAVFAPTLSEQRAQEEAAKARAEADQKAAAELAKVGLAPVGAAEALRLKLEQGQADRERIEAMRREVQVLRASLERDRVQLDAERAALQEARDEFARARKIVAETEGNAQFKKVLATLEGLKPDKSKTTLQELIDQKQVDQVVAYLNAMQERTRTKVIDEFIKADPKVATDLLERLRTRGLAARAPESTPG